MKRSEHGFGFLRTRRAVDPPNGTSRIVVKIELVQRDRDFRLPEQFAQSENGPGVLEAFVPVAEKDLVQHLDG